MRRGTAIKASHRLSLAFAIAALLTVAPAARALTVPAVPIPSDPLGNVPAFVGAPASPQPVAAPAVPQHPFMAPNGRSNLHNDAYQTDTYTVAGPLGKRMSVRSTLLAHECASVTFDSRGRIVTVCVGVEGPLLAMLDPRTLGLMAERPLPPRTLGSAGGLFTDVSGGGYFYLDQADRAVIPTNNRHVLVFSETDGLLGPGFRLDRDYDLTGAVAADDKLVSALPDWAGRIWFVTTAGVVGSIDPTSGQVRFLNLGEGVANSFAVDETGGVYIVSNAALYRFEAGPDGAPAVSWREPYENIGVQKPGQLAPGSGTTPTLMGPDYVAITDNADPMKVLVYRRAPAIAGDRLVCSQPVFTAGASATDQSLIATGTSIVVENNFGYSGPESVMGGRSTSPGLERVDLDSDGDGCHTVWRSDERAPSVVPKLSLATGLVYTYTKPVRTDGRDPWYFTALDFHTGATVFQRLAGAGLGYNNNYAPVTIGPDGSAYVGVLGGLVALRDSG